MDKKSVQADRFSTRKNSTGKKSKESVAHSIALGSFLKHIHETQIRRKKFPINDPCVFYF